jgi:hypothetical protein
MNTDYPKKYFELSEVLKLDYPIKLVEPQFPWQPSNLPPLALSCYYHYYFHHDVALRHKLICCTYKFLLIMLCA